MPVSFVGKKAGSLAGKPKATGGLKFGGKPPQSAQSEAESPAAASPAPAKSPSHEPAQTSKPSFLKTGSAARQALDEAEARAQARAEEAGRMMRFWIEKGAEAEITFLDGDLLDDGRIDMPMWWEHHVMHAGKWTQFACIAEQEPCPFCDAGDQPALVGALTVINHSPYTIKNGPNAGKVIQDRKQLFVAKRQTIKLLQKLAGKRGGLRYHTYEVSRQDKLSPRVGDLFQWSQECTYQELAAHFEQKLAEDKHFLEPADYHSEIGYKTGEELAQLGIGATPTVGQATGAAGKSLQSQL